jgi:hypothetical protein
LYADYDSVHECAWLVRAGADCLCVRQPQFTSARADTSGFQCCYGFGTRRDIRERWRIRCLGDGILRVDDALRVPGTAFVQLDRDRMDAPCRLGPSASLVWQSTSPFRVDLVIGLRDLRSRGWPMVLRRDAQFVALSSGATGFGCVKLPGYFKRVGTLMSEAASQVIFAWFTKKDGSAPIAVVALSLPVPFHLGKSEELDERPHALLLTAWRKSLRPCQLGDTMETRPEQFR